MDILTILGITVALTSVIGGQILEGGQISTLINAPAFLIVIGGSFGAAMFGSPPRIFLRAMRMLPWVLRPPVHDITMGSNNVVNWCVTVRQQGLLALEDIANNQKDPFLRKALQLLADGTNSVNLRVIMEVDITIKENADIRAVRVFEALGAYCPTLGILGAVLGLIQVMSNLTEPKLLGAGIAVAFVATVYGVAFANLIFIPIARKLREIIRSESHYREMMLDGMIAVAEAENPHNVMLKLEGYRREH